MMGSTEFAGTECFLVDNGSLRPEPTLRLRELASALGERLDVPVSPVSLLHSHKVAPEELGGRRAEIVARALERREGRRRIVFLPLFLGPSRAVTEYLPKVIEAARATLPGLETRVAAPLAGEDPDAPDPRLADILAERARERAAALSTGRRPAVAVVDHGTPVERVNRVREAVAAQVAERLDGAAGAVSGCSMERREGEEYAFNEPMLEHLRSVSGFESGPIVAAMFFLLPGRHAGHGGDVAEILEGLGRGPGEPALMTPLLGDDARIVDILEDRARDAGVSAKLGRGSQ